MGTNGITTYNPATLEVTNQVSVLPTLTAFSTSQSYELTLAKRVCLLVLNVMKSCIVTFLVVVVFRSCLAFFVVVFGVMSVTCQFDASVTDCDLPQ